MKKVMIFGNAMSGKGAERLLSSEGYEVLMVDDKTGIHSDKAIEMLDDIDLFIKSPGIPYTDLVKKVKEKSIKMVDEIEVAYRYLKDHKYKTKIIAVTGTNGKTTVTTKITELLEYAGFKAKYAGNIGVSFADLVMDNKDLDYIVLEISSFQCENLDLFRPDVAMIINLTPDHLARYKDLQDYYMTKFNICKNQTSGDMFILNLDSTEISKIINSNKKLVCADLMTISQKQENADLCVKDSMMRYHDEDVLECQKLALKGKHNLENVLFIVAACKYFNIKNEVIREFLYNTKTIEHRMEEFFDYGQIKFINDSKGTNIDSTKYAIEAFPGCILMCGGFDKKLDWTPLIDLIIKYAKEVYLIGVIAPTLEDMLCKKNYPKEKIHSLKDMKNSLLDMKKRLDPNKKEVILLSPATSSYDQFKNFEERGEVFKKTVKEIFGR